MNREALEKRLQVLAQEREQLLAEANVRTGGIRELQTLLQDVVDVETEDVPAEWMQAEMDRIDKEIAANAS